MKIYKTQEEFLKDCKDGRFEYAGDITLGFDLTERVDIAVRNIKAWDINADNIDASDINAGDINTNRNIKARNIDANNIDANNIDANNIDAWYIDAGNIDAADINAGNINAHHITYYAICTSYKNITCYSIKGTRQNSFHKCLDGKLTIKEKENHENENV